jgi:hypothetical protein
MCGLQRVSLRRNRSGPEGDHPDSEGALTVRAIDA